MKSFLSLDYGSKYYGLARFCPSIETFPRPWKEGLIQEDFPLKLKKIIEEEGFTHLVLGIPYKLSGEMNTQSLLYLDFYEKIKSLLSIPVFTQDEGLSSEEAKILKKNTYQNHSLHSLSALIILRDYLLKEGFEIIEN